ncbi:hypothetical protein [Pulveribacter sp.]|uniref:hypothetical protein n=1 Tax=Pulveribacter sp. TaxID=2678893 RepID=UPI0028AB2CF5|nr:hypothetical protein [Pulveribacter sp.]
MTTEHKTIPSTQRIYDAVCELHALEQVVTRETVAELTGLKLTVVDDRLGALVDDDKIKRVLRGVYVPVERHPPARPIAKMVLPDGTVKIEIGDEVLTLTPREDRALALVQSGAATQAIAIESGRQQALVMAEMAAKLQKIEREYAALRAHREDARQMGLSLNSLSPV